MEISEDVIAVRFEGKCGLKRAVVLERPFYILSWIPGTNILVDTTLQCLRGDKTGKISLVLTPMYENLILPGQFQISSKCFICVPSSNFPKIRF